MIKRKQLSRKERQEIWEKCNGHCAYCGCKLPYEKMHVDHIESIYSAEYDRIKTGEENKNINAFQNLLPTCGSCNRYKHCLGLEEFRSYIGEIVKRLRYNYVTYQIAERFGFVKEIKWDGKFYFEKM